MLAALILSVHVLVIGFNLFGLLCVPVGALLGWQFVHWPAWRLLHIGSLGVTAVQAVAGKTCFLTDWQFMASDRAGATEPMIMSWVNSLIYYQIPLWVFAVAYVAVFAYALALLKLVPIRRR